MKRIISLMLSVIFLIIAVTACADGETVFDESSSFFDESSSTFEYSEDLFEANSCSSEDSSESSNEETINNSDVFSDANESSDEEILPPDIEQSDSIDESSNQNEESSDQNDESSEPNEVPNDNDDNTTEKPNEIVTKVLFDSSGLKDYNSPFLPSYAPFCLYDTTLFSGTVITSISFPFDSLASGYTVDSENLFLPIYIIKKDFSESKSDCTIENGKKVILDFTGKLNSVERGDWITANELSIKVAEDETIAFGDTDMAVLPMFLRNDSTYSFWNKIFDAKGNNNHSLIFKIEGYIFSSTSDEPNTNETKYISFLGDSISTFSGWSNNTNHNSSIGGNKIWYPNNNYTGGNITVEDTWWYKAAKSLGYEIAVNNSWSGSVVNTAQTYNVRAKNLHNTTTGATPDVVVILMGVNDYAAGTDVGNYDGTTTAPTSPTNFSEAYGRLIQNIKDKYEDVEIYCCTFLPDRKRFSGSVNSKGINENEYNEAIRNIAKNMGVNIIDLYKNSGISSTNITQYTVDKLHPNKLGMELIANTVYSAIK